MFECLPQDCEDLIFKFHNENIKNKLRELHKKKFNNVMEELLGATEDMIYYFGEENLEGLEEERDDMPFSTIFLEFQKFLTHTNLFTGAPI